MLGTSHISLSTFSWASFLLSALFPSSIGLFSCTLLHVCCSMWPLMREFVVRVFSPWSHGNPLASYTHQYTVWLSWDLRVVILSCSVTLYEMSYLEIVLGHLYQCSMVDVRWERGSKMVRFRSVPLFERCCQRQGCSLVINVHCYDLESSGH